MKKSAIGWLCTLLFFSAQRAIAEGSPSEVEFIDNVAYYEGPDADPVRHRLDMYLPKGQKNFPVLFFIHGGGWVQGHKNQLGMYAVLGRNFARQGIGVVCPNYRLSPAVRHPAHIRDVARAFAWTHKNIGKYGGDAAEIFVAGHSAGGHLAALLGTDERYVKERGLSIHDIRGVIPVSGLFTIPDDRSFWVPFSSDAAARREASPIQHVQSGAPPFLILLGDHDLPSCDMPQAAAFRKALEEKKVPVQLVEVKSRNHLSILINASVATDPVFQAILSFMETRVALGRLDRGGPVVLDTLGGFISRYALLP